MLNLKHNKFGNRQAKFSVQKTITRLGNKIYFHSPYHDEYGIYEWKIGSEEVKKVASYSSHLRGLSEGRFLAKGNSNYTIISLG
ncbi:MAG: hypothetical protein HC846_10740 [Blastocatellia bacterium]|nr:hypothetical protein [Blastocatellia bacterium]